MPYKKIEKKCEICGSYFIGIPTKKTCSKECFSRLKSIQKSGKILQKKCEYCGNVFEVKSKREKKNQKFCSNECSINSKKGKSLYELGYSKKQVEEHINRNVKRNLNNKGKSLEELYGKEKARMIKESKSDKIKGALNPMSLYSISDRFGCSLIEASRLTPAYGRKKELHPMYGKTHTLEAKKRIIKSLQKNHNGNVIQGTFDGILWQGSWELMFIVDCIENNINIRRYDFEPIKYYVDEKEYHFFPDFIIEDNFIVEIKGMYKNTEKNKEKKRISMNIKNFIFIDELNFFPKNGNNFILNSIHKYGKRIKVLQIPNKETRSIKEIKEYLKYE